MNLTGQDELLTAPNTEDKTAGLDTVKGAATGGGSQFGELPPPLPTVSASGSRHGRSSDIKTCPNLRTNRGLLKFILLSLITLGIYAIVVYSHIGVYINRIASRYDGKETMHFYLLSFVISPLTLGIGTLVWFSKISNRIGNELARRNINYEFNFGTYWR